MTVAMRPLADPVGAASHPPAAPANASSCAPEKPSKPAREGTQKCEFYLKNKCRNCKFDAVPGKRFCGNHLFQMAQEGGRRILCPYDPKQSHTVLESDLERHKARCPNYLLWLADRAQPYYQADVNAGPACGADDLLPDAPPEFADRHGRTDTSGARRPAYAAALGEERFKELLLRIEAAHAQISPPEAHSVLVPPEATSADRMAQQQASIVANMDAVGLLRGAEARLYVEMGAGKGFLSSALAGAVPQVRGLVMVDSHTTYKNKADKALRSLAIQRLRCDLKDFLPAGVPGLEAGQPWVAMAKHLCGAATDYALRCCARDRARWLGLCTQAAHQARAGAADEPPTCGAAAAAQGISEGAEGVAGACCGAQRGVQGLAVATCCHHRCTWQHYVGRDVFQELGFTPQEFELIAWMTGWALCGHELPPGCQAADGRELDGEAGSFQAASAEQAAGVPAAVVGDCSTAGQSAAAGAAGWRPHHALPRPERVRLGQLCKGLLDAGRLRWLQRQAGLHAAQLLTYCHAEVSGENRLLLGAWC